MGGSWHRGGRKYAPEMNGKGEKEEKWEEKGLREGEGGNEKGEKGENGMEKERKKKKKEKKEMGRAEEEKYEISIRLLSEKLPSNKNWERPSIRIYPSYIWFAMSCAYLLPCLIILWKDWR